MVGFHFTISSLPRYSSGKLLLRSDGRLRDQDWQGLVLHYLEQLFNRHASCAKRSMDKDKPPRQTTMIPL